MVVLFFSGVGERAPGGMKASAAHFSGGGGVRLALVVAVVVVVAMTVGLNVGAEAERVGP